ncbi:MAG TPA: acetylxylan esterase [Methylomirabilota bacterium]|nr:acetylxylan esterase [Methylomirabilota bacterium]
MNDLLRCLEWTAASGALLLLAGCVTAGGRFPEAALLPSQPELPDPLVSLDGTRVTTPQQWERRRRPELQALFQHYMYGAIPKAVPMQSKIHGVHPDFLGGKATLKLVQLEAPRQGPKIDLLLVVPNQRPGPAPVFLAMNFCGNHALTDDPRVPLARGWLYNTCKGCTNNLATEAARGGQAADWPLARIIERGYALASFCTSDIDSDRREVSDGIYAWLAGGDPARNNPTNRGSLAAWAWGFHRCVDYLATDRDVDARRIAAVGHSRNGKAALLATAYDERIALAIPHQAGCGGTAPSRVAPALAAPQANGRPIAETIAVINRNFPHWFNGEFKKFNDAPDRLPFDQHCLVALCAPRPVLFSNAQEDQWANPSQQFEVLQAADPVYRLLGVEGLTAKEMPARRKLVDSRLGYYIRDGRHSMTADDWEVFMNFADRHFR